MHFLSMRSACLTFFLLLFLGTGTLTAETSRFTDLGKGAVMDNQTGLMWQKGDSYHDLKKGMNWYEALEYIDKKNTEKYAGFSDWRLPTIEEIHKIWDPKRPILSKDGDSIGLPKVFTGGGSYYVWTANERNLDHAWYYGLGQQEDYFNLKDLGDLDQGVKMVRNAK